MKIIKALGILFFDIFISFAVKLFFSEEVVIISYFFSLFRWVEVSIISDVLTKLVVDLGDVDVNAFYKKTQNK